MIPEDAVLNLDKPLQCYFKQLGITPKMIAKMAEPEALMHLEEIFVAHIKSFPFQNFDLRKASQQHPAFRKSLDLFNKQKFMSGHNGGFCFQTAELLFQVLLAQGFNVHRSIGKVLSGMAIDAAEAKVIPATHLVLVVTVGEKRLLVDPSMAMNGNRKPILIQDQKDVSQEGHNFFQIERVNDEYLISRRTNTTEFKTVFHSSLAPATDKQIDIQLEKLQCYPVRLGIRDIITLVAIATDTDARTLLCSVKDGIITFNYTVDPYDSSPAKTEIFTDVDRAYRLILDEFKINHISRWKFENFCTQISWPSLEKSADVMFPIDQYEVDRWHELYKPY